MAGLRSTPREELAGRGSFGCAGFGCLALVVEAELTRLFRVGGFGRVAGLGQVERPGQARAGLRGGASPVVFEEDPGSVACPGSIPPIVSP